MKAIKKCDFCDSTAFKNLDFKSDLKKVPEGLTRKLNANFSGYICLNCRSIKNKYQFDNSKYLDGFYSQNVNYDRGEDGYDYTGNLVSEIISRAPDILELGSGQGALARHLKNQGVKVSVLEPDPGYMKILETDFKETFKEINDVNRKYSLVLSVAVLEHVEDTLEHIKEIFSKLIIDNGVLICQFPNVNSLSARLSLSKWDMIFEPGHNAIPSVVGLNILLRKNGFEIVKHKSASILSRGRLPFFWRRFFSLECVYKKLINSNRIFRAINRCMWTLQDLFELGETIVITVKRKSPGSLLKES